MKKLQETKIYIGNKLACNLINLNGFQNPEGGDEHMGSMLVDNYVEFCTLAMQYPSALGNKESKIPAFDMTILGSDELGGLYFYSYHGVEVLSTTPMDEELKEVGVSFSAVSMSDMKRI